MHLQNAIVGAVNWDGCDGLPESERADCKLDKAIVNVGSLYSKVSSMRTPAHARFLALSPHCPPCI